MLKLSHRRPTRPIPDCSIFAFLGEGVLDVGSTSDIEERHIAVLHMS